MNKTKAVRVKKKPAAAHVMTRVQVKKLLDEQVKLMSAIQDLKRECMEAMVQNHNQTHSKLKRIHEGAIDTYNAMNEGMMDLSDSICNVEEELKRKRWRSKFAKLVEEQDRIEHLL
jgi:predicted house-cleaning NTP pyrophosphatase (Maf/HAM1 superfamily)